MNKMVYYLCFILLFNACSIENKSNMGKYYVDVTENISVEKFKAIVAVILKEGDFKLYSNRYGFSPHYKLNGFNVYLAPSDEHINSVDDLSKEISHYNTIVIQDFSSEISYTRVVVQEDRVVLKVDDKHTERIVQEKFLAHYLLVIEQELLNSKMDDEYIDITANLSVVTFKTIAAVILKDGDRRFYCNKYNNSPHYKVDRFDVYLDPIDQRTNLTPDRNSNDVPDYNAIVIQDSNGVGSTQYYHILLEGDAIRLTGTPETESKESVHKDFLHTYLPLLEKTFQLNELND